MKISFPDRGKARKKTENFLFLWRERREKYIIFLSLRLREKNVNSVIFPRGILRENNIPLKGDNFLSFPEVRQG